MSQPTRPIRKTPFSSGDVARCLLAVALLAAPAAAQRGPLPVEKTITLREDNSIWFVEGRQRIKSNVRLTGLRACTIQAVGEDAVIEVEGALDLRAATGGEILIDGVWIEPLPGCKGVTLMNTRFDGAGGVRTAQGEPVDAEVTLNGSQFRGKSKLDLALISGKLVMMGCGSSEPITLRGLTSPQQVRNTLEVVLVGCYGRDRGFDGGLHVEGAKDVTVRNVDLGGAESLLVDCGKLVFDGNNAHSRRIELRRTAAASFASTKVSGTDFRCEELLLIQPAGAGDPQKLRLEGCWFDGRTDPAEIRAHMLKDAAADPANGVLANFAKIQPQPLGFAGGAR